MFLYNYLQLVNIKVVIRIFLATKVNEKIIYCISTILYILWMIDSESQNNLKILKFTY